MALSKLKGFFKDNMNQRRNPTYEDINNVIDSSSNKNFEEWGFEKAKHLNGSDMGLLQSLARLREDHRRVVRRDQLKQNKLKQPLIVERDGYMEEINQEEKKIKDVTEKQIPSLQNKITNLEKEVSKIKQNPEEIMPDKLNKASFFIGLIILLALTVYLFIFYSSASYSAFFKEFTANNIGVANSIFDPQAITKAYQDGFTELILIVSMPFVFIGLGFLIHKFQEEKGYSKYFKIAMLIVITFAFDAILAYEITEKIYNIKAENSFADIPPYNFQLAFQSVNFWLIIFAGFVVYLIWGFVFDFTIESYDKLNVIKQAIKTRENEVEKYKKEIVGLEKDVESSKGKINSLNLKCRRLNNNIDGVIIDTAEFDKILHEFVGGWTHWMTANKKTPMEIERATRKANQFIENNINILVRHNYNTL